MSIHWVDVSMRVLVVEDDQYKAKQLSAFLRDSFETAVVDIASSVSSGMNRIKSGEFDLILLDMSLPTYDVGPSEAGGRPQSFGGRELLRYIDRLNIITPVIVVTQYERFSDKGKEHLDLESLNDMLFKQHSLTYQGLVFFASTNDNWRDSLRSAIVNILTHKIRR